MNMVAVTRPAVNTNLQISGVDIDDLDCEPLLAHIRQLEAQLGTVSGNREEVNLGFEASE